MIDSEKISILHPDLSKLYAYGDFEIRKSSAITVLSTLSQVCSRPDTEALQERRAAILQLLPHEDQQIRQLVSDYDEYLDPSGTLNRVGRVGKNLLLAILYLEMGREGDALWALDAASQLLAQPIVQGEDGIGTGSVSEEIVANTITRLRRRLFLTARNTIFSNSGTRDTREE